MLTGICTMSRETLTTAHHDIVVEHLREQEMRCDDLRVFEQMLGHKILEYG